MIEFGCPHCGKQLFHHDEFAGRDGWCRFCKGIILIPHPGQTATLPTLTPEQRYARLDRMFKHAASIVDEHRQLQARLQNGGTGLVEELRLRTEAQRAAESLNARVEEAQRLQHASEEEAARLQNRIAELDQYGAELRQQLEDEANERKQLESALEEAQAEAGRIPELEEQQKETRNALDEQLQENDSLLERLLDVEQALETATQNAEESAQAWESERAALEERLERLRNELCAADDESAELREKLAQSDESFAQIRTELETANAAVSEERDSLRQQLERTKTELADVSARHEEAVKEAAESARAKESAEKRAAESRAAWDEQRQQLLDEIDSVRAAQRAAEEETAAVRTRNRETAAELQAQVDQLELDRANESRLRAAAEESAQRAQRRAAEAETALDDALARREALARHLETARTDLESERETCTQLTSEIAEAKASIEAHKTRLAEAQGERDDAIDRLSKATGELQATQRINAQLRTQVFDLEEMLTDPSTPEPDHSEADALKAEMETLLQKVTDLEEALAASKREKSRLEQRLVSTENRAAYSELEGVGYRSKFSSMAKQFFEQEVARLSGAQEEDGYPGNGDTPHDADEPGAAAILDAVSELRR